MLLSSGMLPIYAENNIENEEENYEEIFTDYLPTVKTVGGFCIKMRYT